MYYSIIDKENEILEKKDTTIMILKSIKEYLAAEKPDKADDTTGYYRVLIKIDTAKSYRDTIKVKLK
jgi:hypothetical protein